MAKIPIPANLSVLTRRRDAAGALAKLLRDAVVSDATGPYVVGAFGLAGIITLAKFSWLLTLPMDLEAAEAGWGMVTSSQFELAAIVMIAVGIVLLIVGMMLNSKLGEELWDRIAHHQELETKEKLVQGFLAAQEGGWLGYKPNSKSNSVERKTAYWKAWAAYELGGAYQKLVGNVPLAGRTNKFFVSEVSGLFGVPTIIALAGAIVFSMYPHPALGMILPFVFIAAGALVFCAPLFFGSNALVHAFAFQKYRRKTVSEALFKLISSGQPKKKQFSTKPADKFSAKR
ncbi:MAG: hypothetical protein HRF49_03480 [bacterium]|jgi:hypothetical protein